MVVELQSFAVVMQVKVCIAQLTVDGTQNLQVFCANLHGGLEERNAGAVILHLTETLPLQSQVHTGCIHPAGAAKTSCSFNDSLSRNKLRRQDVLITKINKKLSFMDQILCV